MEDCDQLNYICPLIKENHKLVMFLSLFSNSFGVQITKELLQFLQIVEIQSFMTNSQYITDPILYPIAFDI